VLDREQIMSGDPMVSFHSSVISIGTNVVLSHLLWLAHFGIDFITF